MSTSHATQPCQQAQHQPPAAHRAPSTVKVDGTAGRGAAHPMPDWHGPARMPTTMMQACEAAGVVVPHYCYHPKLPVAGNCRMCLVEFGTPALGPDRQPVLHPDGTAVDQEIPAPGHCLRHARVSPGMEIYTDTPTVKAMREGVLEFLLINHPLDCPICDQAGECKLQEYSVQYGQAASRFVEAKVHKPKRGGSGPAHHAGRRALHPLLPLHPLHARHCGRRRPGHRQPRQLQHLDRLSRPRLRQQLHPQHRRSLPGRRADLEGFPLPDAGLVPQGNAEPLHQLRHRLQHPDRLPREPASIAIPRGKTTRQWLLDVRCRPAQLQMDRARTTGWAKSARPSRCQAPGLAGGAGGDRRSSSRRRRPGPSPSSPPPARPTKNSVCCENWPRKLEAVTDSVPRSGRRPTTCWCTPTGIRTAPAPA